MSQDFTYTQLYVTVNQLLATVAVIWKPVNLFEQQIN